MFNTRWTKFLRYERQQKPLCKITVRYGDFNTKLGYKF